MRLTNTLSGTTEELRPLVPGRVGVYVCGITPYAPSHLGHAMSAVVYDVLVRYLRWSGNARGGYAVTYVSNYTDVDDKAIARARELGISPETLVAEQIERWEGEQRELGLLFPDVRPRVTTEIDTIIAQIEAILANGYGYATPAGDVYFRVRRKADYGKLSHRDIDELRAGTRGEPGEDKEFPLDFALWKAEKPGEPAWPSPWGPGRPGWHIECSAMSQRYLGETFDIHGGGIDLVFPHHENEVAQAEAATGRPFARLWMHNGLVRRDGEKMSKSLGNVLTVREALDRWSADALRLFVLGSHYRGPNNLTDAAMTAATRGAERLRLAAAGASDGPAPADTTPETPETPAAPETAAEAERYRARFRDAMEDDLGTPAALATLFDLARAINRGTASVDDGGEAGDVRALRAALVELGGVLGLDLGAGGEDPAAQRAAQDAALDAVALARLAAHLDVACGGGDAPATVSALLARREQARGERDFATADAIRDGLAAAGVTVEDTPAGPRWSAGR